MYLFGQYLIQVNVKTRNLSKWSFLLLKKGNGLNESPIDHTWVNSVEGMTSAWIWKTTKNRFSGIIADSSGINLTKTPWKQSSYYTPSEAHNQSLLGPGQEKTCVSQCLTKDRPFRLNTSIRDTRKQQCITSRCNPDNSIRLANYETKHRKHRSLEHCSAFQGTITRRNYMGLKGSLGHQALYT